MSEGVGPFKKKADLAVLLARAGREVQLRDLEDDLDQAERHADSARATTIAAERDALVAELTAAFGLAGRRRGAGPDPDERLRKAVSARVKATIERLDDLHPRLARHLRSSVRTGFWCVYAPE